MSGRSNPDILLAFDFGLRRVGIATANLHTRTASPLTTLALDDDLLWVAIDRMITDWQPARLLVGVPKTSDDESTSPIAARARAFAHALEEHYRLPVATVDESLTSRAARSALKEGRRSGYLRRRIAKDRVDRHAACLIAEQWMNEQADALTTE